MNTRKLSLLLSAMMGSALIAGSPAFAGSDTNSASTTVPASSGLNLPAFTWNLPSFNDWRNGNSATANWLGLGYPLKDYGLSFEGAARDVYFGQVAGGYPNGNQPKSNFIEEVKLRATYDFSTLFGIEGLTITSGWRYRNVGANNPGYAAGTTGITGAWNPTDMSSGFGMRMMSQMIQYVTPNNAFMLNAGMENPYDQFLQQPLSKTFENNMINSTKGIGMQQGPGIPVPGGAGGYINPYNSINNTPRNYGAAGVGWSSSYLAWGATLKVKPIKDFYIQSGIYEAVAGDTGVSPSQLGPINVYPYTSIPKSYLGTMKYSGETVPVVGGNGQLIPGATQNLGWVPAYQNNHGFNFGGAPGNNIPTAYVNVTPTANASGTTKIFANGKSTYTNAAGQTVASPGYYAGTPYNQGGVGGNYSGNGVWNMNEIGWTPKLGADKLEGHYAIGSYIWGLPNYSYTPTTYNVSVYNPKTGYTATSVYSTKAFPSAYNGLACGIYLQGDQMLFRHHDSDSSVGSGKNVVDSKNPAPAAPHSFSDRGLYMFSEANFTPPQNNAMPFYFQTGLVYKGLFDARPKDTIGVVVGAGFYSSYLNNWQSIQNHAYQNAYTSAYNATVPNGPTTFQKVNPNTGVVGGAYNNTYQYLPNYTTTEVVEFYYSVQINKWCTFKPYAQCIMNPAGNGTVGTDWTLGARLAVIF